MKWIPWLVAAILAVVDVAVYQSAQKQVADQKAVNEAKLKQAWQKVETAQASVAKRRDGLEATLKEEEADTRKLESAKEKLEGDRDGHKGAIEKLDGEITALKTARDEASRKTEENKAKLQDLQTAIASRERDIAVLEKVMTTVMEARELSERGLR